MKKVFVLLICLLFLVGCSKSKESKNSTEEVKEENKTKTVSVWDVVPSIEATDVAIFSPAGSNLKNLAIYYTNKKDPTTPFPKDYFFAKVNNGWNYYDKSFKLVLETNFPDISQGDVFGYKAFLYDSNKTDGTMIYFDTDGNYEEKPRSITCAIGDYPIFLTKTKEIIDGYNCEVLTPKQMFDKYTSGHEDSLLFKTFEHLQSYYNSSLGYEIYGDCIFLLTKDGDVKVIAETIPSGNSIFSNDMFAVKPYSNDSITYYDLSTNCIGAFVDGKGFYEGIAPVFNGSKWGYINTTGQQVVDFIFDSATEVSDSKAMVVYKGKVGRLNIVDLVKSGVKINEELLDSNKEIEVPLVENNSVTTSGSVTTNQENNQQGNIISGTVSKPSDKSQNSSSQNVNSFPYQIKVIGDSLKIRSGPGKTYEHIGSVKKGEVHTAYEKKTADGYTWYRIGNDMWIPDENGEWITRN